MVKEDIRHLVHAGIDSSGLFPVTKYNPPSHSGISWTLVFLRKKKVELCLFITQRHRNDSNCKTPLFQNTIVLCYLESSRTVSTKLSSHPLVFSYPLFLSFTLPLFYPFSLVQLARDLAGWSPILLYN